MDANNGEVWAKLDAGTEDYFKLINRTKIPFARILKNISETAKVRPVIIQSLFLKYQGAGPPGDEIEAYCGHLREITKGGGLIKLVQVYTVARRPAVQGVEPLSDGEVDAITDEIRERTGLEAEAYYGSSSWGE